jgi:hypothetical protein
MSFTWLGPVEDKHPRCRYQHGGRVTPEDRVADANSHKAAKARAPAVEDDAIVA